MEPPTRPNELIPLCTEQMTDIEEPKKEGPILSAKALPGWAWALIGIAIGLVVLALLLGTLYVYRKEVNEIIDEIEDGSNYT